MQSYSAYQFALVRILIGLYFLLGFAPYLLDSLGPRPEALQGLTAYRYAVGALTAPGLFLALFVLLGFFRRLAAIGLFALTALFLALLQPQPGLAGLAELDAGYYVLYGLQLALLLLVALAPEGEPFALESRGDTVRLAAWGMPAWLFYVGWLLLLASQAAWFLQPELWGGYLPAMAILFVFCLDGRWFPARPAKNPQSKSEHPIVFFDGVCGLCNTSVDWIMREDRAGVFRYAPLQGESAQELLPDYDMEAMDSMVYRDENGKLWQRSDAILNIGVRLGNIWRPLAMTGKLIPRVLRNALYNYIAAHRYQWFGKKDACRMPTPEERELFLM